MSAWALIMAAGSGTRMGMATNKALLPLAGRTLLERSARAFAGLTDGAVIVAAERDLDAIRAMGLDAKIAVGGDTRQRSVLNGLRALPEDAGIVLVHDAARPFVTEEIIRRCIDSAAEYGSGVACVPIKDTVKRVGPAGTVRTIPRDALRAAQTPQAFRVAALKRAIEALEARGETATDDASALEAAGETVRLVEGSYDNLKLTTPEDMALAEWLLDRRSDGGAPRVGYGFDAHRLAEGRPLVLLGVDIPFEKGLLGHSDADVACHALMDALLGAAALGDIGLHFPDSDPAYKGISSMRLLERVVALLRARGLAAWNADVTIVAERPKLRPYMAAMAQGVADALGIPMDRVNVKATTTEGMGFEGEGRGMSAHAVATVGRAE